MAGEQKSKGGKQKLDKHKETHVNTHKQTNIKLKKATWHRSTSDSTEDDELKHVSQ